MAADRQRPARARTWAAVVVAVFVAMSIVRGGNAIAQAVVGEAPYQVVVIGDSITGGSAVGGVGPDGWPTLTWNKLQSHGIEVVPHVSAAGGSGYVQPGGDNGSVFPEEAARLVAPNDSVIVFFGSRNDASQPVDAVAAAARQSWEEARRVAPGAVLIVIGPIPPDADRHDPVLAIRDALYEQATQAGVVWVDPIAEGWLTAPGLIGWDGVHPNNAGHQELANRIEPIIEGALAL
jgi:lysophospholipase L1-like esterase